MLRETTPGSRPPCLPLPPRGHSPSHKRPVTPPLFAVCIRRAAGTLCNPCNASILHNVMRNPPPFEQSIKNAIWNLARLSVIRNGRAILSLHRSLRILSSMLTYGRE